MVDLLGCEEFCYFNESPLFFEMIRRSFLSFYAWVSVVSLFGDFRLCPLNFCWFVSFVATFLFLFFLFLLFSWFGRTHLASSSPSEKVESFATIFWFSAACSSTMVTFSYTTASDELWHGSSYFWESHITCSMSDLIWLTLSWIIFNSVSTFWVSFSKFFGFGLTHVDSILVKIVI